MLHRAALTLCLLTTLTLLACEDNKKPSTPSPAPTTAPAQTAPGAKTAPADDPAEARPKPRKPRYVPCDPKRPELPCTPDTWPEKEGAAKRPPHAKPRHVPCDPKRPELPCTPETKLPAPAP